AEQERRPAAAFGMDRGDDRRSDEAVRERQGHGGAPRLAGSLALADHELQSGPHVAHRAHLDVHEPERQGDLAYDVDVHEPERQGDLAYDVLGNVGWYLRRFLRPRYPDEPGLLQLLAERGQLLLERRPLRGEEMNGVGGPAGFRDDDEARRKLP